MLVVGEFLLLGGSGVVDVGGIDGVEDESFVFILLF